jgi:hypothetical protein
MKEPSFDSTPDFQHFREVMRSVLKVPKARVDELVTQAEKISPRRGNPQAAGRRKAKVSKGATRSRKRRAQPMPEQK